MPGKPESVFFYTFHKCASSLFSGYILPRARGLEHRDINALAVMGKLAADPVIEDRGCIYGPIRLSSRGDLPNYEAFRRKVGQPGFVRDRLAVCLVRDPRDLVVSAYYSFGFSHVLSKLPEVRARQEARRDRIQSMTLDQFAIEDAPRWVETFDEMSAILDACPRAVLLRYEDMVDAWNVFERDLTRHLSFSAITMREIYDRSRPRSTEDPKAHKRSGRAGGFRGKLKPETIAALDATFAPILQRYGFDKPVPPCELREPAKPLGLHVVRAARALRGYARGLKPRS